MCAFLMLGRHPPAGAQNANRTTVPVRSAAWYAAAPLCTFQPGCSTAAPPNPYPAGSLHVAISAGQTTATTYLTIDLSELPADARFTSASLRLPVDPDGTHGSQSPETADMTACLVRGTVDERNAPYGTPPATDCGVFAHPTYQAAAGGTAFVVDVTRIVAARPTTDSASLALVPSAAAQTGRQTWHVTFYGRQSLPERSVRADVTYEIDEGAPQLSETDEGSIAGPTPAGLPATAFANIWAVALPEAGSPSVVDNGTSPAVAVPAFSSAPTPAGFAYPIVWALPLVLVIGGVYIGHTLTHDPRPAVRPPIRR
jgi:hypothetical protein